MKRTFLIASLFFAQLAYGSPVDIWVSTKGSDINQGSKDKPVKTLNAARDLIRRIKGTEQYPGDGFTVWVEGGNYYMDSPLALNELDSGTPDAPITWRTTGKDEVHLIGGKELPSNLFKSVSGDIKKRLTRQAAANVKCINLKALGITNYGEHKQIGHALSVYPAPLELFINNEPMSLAHYPNNGFVQIGKVIDGGSVPRNGDYSCRGAIFEYTDPRHEIWAKSDDVWFQGTFANGYADDKIKVEKIDTKKKQVKLSTPHLYGVKGGQKYQHYVVLNVLDELDSPGEWYLDRKSGMLYVWPKTNIAKSNVMVSILEDPVVCLEGASNIVFRDFIVEDGRGIGIYLERTTNNIIAGCVVRNMGNTGVSFGQGAKQTVPYITHDDYEGVPQSRIIGNYSGHIYKYTTWDRHAGNNNRLLSCDIYNVGSGGVILSGGSKRFLTPGNNSVENCKIHDYNRHNKFRWGGVIVDGCGNKVLHNEIYNSDFQAIFTVGPEHLFEYNNIHDVTLHSDDVSAWYTGRDPSDRGLVLRYNYFHDCGNAKRMNMGVYCDDSTTGVMVYGNVFYNMHTGHGVLYSNTGWDLTMKNNIVINPTGYTVVLSPHYYTWYKKGAVSTFTKGSLFEHRLLEVINIKKPPYSERYPELCNYMDVVKEGEVWEGMNSRRNILTRNVIIGGKANPISIGGGKNGVFKNENNLMLPLGTDPGFVDMKGNNFMLKKDSEVYKQLKDFEPIPFDKIGLYEDVYRKNVDSVKL